MEIGDFNAQTALSNVVAPKAAKDGFVHDSYLCQESGLIKGSKHSAFPTQRGKSTGFVSPPFYSKLFLTKVPKAQKDTEDFNVFLCILDLCT